MSHSAAAALISLLALPAAAQRIDQQPLVVRHGLTGTYVHSRTSIDGIEIVGEERVDHLRNGEARFVAILAAAGGWESQATRNREGLVYLRHDGALHLARRHIVEDRPLERYAVYVDLKSGTVLRKEALFFRAQARIFRVNPVAALNRPELQDGNDSRESVPDAAYRIVDLTGLLPGGALSGPHVTIVDSELPATTRADASQPLLFHRDESQFEEVNAYAAIDANQQYLQSLGYSGERRIAAYPIPVDAHAASGADASYYIQSSTPGRGALFFGDGGTDDAEDTDLVLHEYAHAIEDWIAPGAFAGAASSESRASGEGFGDYWAFSSTFTETVASGRDPACIADWDARCWLDDASQRCSYPPGSDCLRRTDGTRTMADFRRTDSSGTEHRNGEIWSSALREIFLRLIARLGPDRGRRAADTIVIESHFGTAPNPTFASIARRMIVVDRLLGFGAAPAICPAMTSRGILTLAGCDASLRGELTYVQSPQRGTPIPDNTPSGVVSEMVIDDPRAIEKLFVRVDLEHPSRGDLRMVLVAPDGTEVMLQDVSNERASGIHATYGLDAFPVQSLDVLRGRAGRGIWRLRVEDLLPRESGRLAGWSLLIQFAGDVPSAARPSAAFRRVIPAAAGLSAVATGGASYATDLVLLNRGVSRTVANVVFTPSGADGNITFQAIRVDLPPGQVVTMTDVVSQLQTAGTGQLEVNSDAELLVESRTWSGAYGERIGAVDPSSAAGTGTRLLIPRIERGPERRTNVGVAETAGEAGVVRIRFFNAQSGALLGVRDETVGRFGHLQFAVPFSEESIVGEVEVSRGNARIVAYASVIETRSNDFHYVEAAPVAVSRTVLLPVISAGGAGTEWTSDLWLATSGPAAAVPALFTDARTGERQERTLSPAPSGRAFIARNVVRDVFGRDATSGLLRLELPAGVAACSRITTMPHGTFQAIPADDSPAQETLDIIGFSDGSGRPRRINASVVNRGESAATVDLVVMTEGNELARIRVQAGPMRLVQTPIPLAQDADRIRLLVNSGRGTISGYASVIDNVAQDAVLFPAR